MRQVRLFIITLCVCFLATSQTPPPAKTVHFKELQKILPVKAPDGFTREKPKGQTVSSSGISSSNASVTFSALKKEKQLQTMDDGKQDSVEVEVTLTASIEIIDYAGLGEGMFASLHMMTETKFENETEDGYEKTTTFNGYKGIEKSHTEEYSRSCGLQLVVGDRFLVNATGNGFSETAVLQTLLNSMDLKKLETLK